VTRTKYQAGPATDHYHNALGPAQESGSGGVPDEWTVDEFGNVVIAPTDNPEDLGNVHIVAAPNSNDAFTLTDSDNPDTFHLGIDPFGYILGTGADFSSDQNVTVLKATGPNGSPVFSHDLFQARNTEVGRGLRVIRSGFVVLNGANTGPDQDTLAAGELAFWFDSTNGAAKLMVRAKQADGTVVNGSVNLTP